MDDDISEIELATIQMALKRLEHDMRHKLVSLRDLGGILTQDQVQRLIQELSA